MFLQVSSRACPAASIPEDSMFVASVSYPSNPEQAKANTWICSTNILNWFKKEPPNSAGSFAVGPPNFILSADIFTFLDVIPTCLLDDSAIESLALAIMLSTEALNTRRPELKII